MAIDQITTGVIKDNAVTAAKIPAGAVVADVGAGGIGTTQLAADAVDGTKLADNAVNSEHYTDGSIDLAHLSADSVDGTKIVDDAINSEHYAAGSIDTAHIADDQITGAKIENNPTIAGNLTVSGKTTLTGDLVPSLPLGHRNMIINGAMQVAQRGTTFGITTSNNGGYALDRFSFYMTATTDQYAATMSQNGLPDADVQITGHTKALKIDTTTAEGSVTADEYASIVYKVEAQDCQRMCSGRTNAKSVTLSFWAYSSVAGDYAISMYQQDGDEIIGSKYTLAANTWSKVEITFAGNTGSNIVDDTGLGLQLKWILFAGSNWTSSNNTSWGASANAKIAYGHTAVWGTNASHDFYLTGVQLELGSSATPFEWKAWSEELHRCQRYFEWASDYTGYANNSNGCDGGMGFKVDKRSTSSTAVLINGTQMLAHPHIVGISPTGLTISQQSTSGCYMSFNGSGAFTQGGNAGGVVSFYQGAGDSLQIIDEL